MRRTLVCTGRDVRVDLCSDTLSCFKNSLYLGLNYEGVSQSLADYRDKIDHDHSGATIGGCGAAVCSRRALRCAH